VCIPFSTSSVVVIHGYRSLIRVTAYTLATSRSSWILIKLLLQTPILVPKPRPKRPQHNFLLFFLL
jgi:hypothetical protein